MWEQRQAYLFQTIIEYGDLEVERAGAAKLELVSEKQQAAAKTLDKFLDLTYHNGISGLLNYGILNDPSLPAALTPGTKQAGGVKWIAAGIVNATAEEIYEDFQSMFNQLASVSQGYITAESSMKLVYPNTVAGALTAINSFGITIKAFIKETFPQYRIRLRSALRDGGGQCHPTDRQASSTASLPVIAASTRSRVTMRWCAACRATRRRRPAEPGAPSFVTRCRSPRCWGCERCQEPFRSPVKSPTV